MRSANAPYMYRFAHFGSWLGASVCVREDLDRLGRETWTRAYDSATKYYTCTQRTQAGVQLLTTVPPKRKERENACVNGHAKCLYDNHSLLHHRSQDDFVCVFLRRMWKMENTNKGASAIRYQSTHKEAVNVRWTRRTIRSKVLNVMVKFLV